MREPGLWGLGRLARCNRTSCTILISASFFPSTERHKVMIIDRYAFFF